MPYRLIALDVDGTAVETGKGPTPGVLHALAAAQERGVRVVVATGRAFESAHSYAQMLGVRGPVICMQGALVCGEDTCSPPILADAVPDGPLDDVIRFADARDLELTLYTEDRLYVSRMRHDLAYYDLWFSVPVVQVADLAETAAALRRQGVPLIKGLLIAHPADGDPLERELAVFLQGSLSITRSHAHFVEVVAPTVSKGRAVAFLAERYGIAQSETIAIGDSGNDISMIRWAGLGVAVANAARAVQSAANYIAPPVSEDGVARVIERFVLDGRARF